MSKSLVVEKFEADDLDGERWLAVVEDSGVKAGAFGDTADQAIAAAETAWAVLARPIVFCPACGGSGLMLRNGRHDEAMVDDATGHVDVSLSVASHSCGWQGVVASMQNWYSWV